MGFEILENRINFNKYSDIKTYAIGIFDFGLIGRNFFLNIFYFNI